MPDPATELTTDELAERLIRGERRALSRAITLVESTRPDHRNLARALLKRLSARDSVARRIGLSGTPGVGKSTFIEAMGMRLVEAGEKVAVLAVDPSSKRSGGSILGDKTRMEQLARHPNAFIRPSPSQGSLGGVARRTRETIRLVEAAGFGTVLVETVGVGQSETMVAEMTDIFVLLLAPAGGDELQGVKRGIMEIADLIVVNKADGALKPVAETTRTEYSGALHLMRRRSRDPDGYPKALCVSAMTGDGLDDLWQAVEHLHRWRAENGVLDKDRAEQAVSAMQRLFERRAIEHIRTSPEIAAHLPQLTNQVAGGKVLPEEAVDELMTLLGMT